MIDRIDRQVIHALQCSPRAPFSVVAQVVGVSEQTVGRRYRKLRENGVIRVIGRTPAVDGGSRAFFARIRCLPSRIVSVAESIARYPEAQFVHLSAGGAEIVCLIHSPASGSGNDLLLERLPRATAVLDVSVHLAFHRYGTPGASDDWTGFPDGLDEEQRSALEATRRPRTGAVIFPGPEDAPLLAALAEDGRAGYATLAAATGWSQDRVVHRIGVLERAGTLVFDVDVLPEQLGFTTQAVLWLSVTPAYIDELGTALAADPQVVFTAATTGRHNVVAVLVCRDDHDLYRHLTTTIAALPGVAGYEISLTTRKLKQAASLVVAGALRTSGPVKP
ncbi:AsnC family transcriptional regulator [Amycolatopsis balhimycina DSM 5908]|uniref:AsnC family transcriptional regulator n=1 Tax=Amycolatopsis balhimycina DSM 5908 TaxID=1081091 RepID=A0A428WPE3_AMYBA|nr:AsnC family transcriptional regulator [Amycolatopsis balhimycina]RSM44924.1 AsnC family transcriptional regulator [Amycolatopsis balhimycina DSM 5908]